MTVIARALLVALVLAAGGCPGGGPAGPDAGLVELGTGTTAWVPLEPEQDLGLVMGPQGGYHFIVHARMKDIAPGDPTRPGIPANPTTRFSAYREDGRQIDLMNPPYRLGYDLEADGWYVLPSGRILQVHNSEVPSIYGQRVRIRVQVTDAEGRGDSDERWVLARDWRELEPDAGPGDAGPGDAGPGDAAVTGDAGPGDAALTGDGGGGAPP